MLPGVICEITQELTKRLRPMECVATEESLDLSELLGFLCHGDYRPGTVTVINEIRLTRKKFRNLQKDTVLRVTPKLNIHGISM